MSTIDDDIADLLEEERKFCIVAHNVQRSWRRRTTSEKLRVDIREHYEKLFPGHRVEVEFEWRRGRRFAGVSVDEENVAEFTL